MGSLRLAQKQIDLASPASVPFFVPQFVINRQHRPIVENLNDVWNSL